MLWWPIAGHNTSRTHRVSRCVRVWCVCVCGVCVVCVCGVRVWCVCHNEVEKVHTHSKMQTSFSSAVQPKRTTRPFWLSHWARTGQAVSE
jgi:hypothetical protein